MGFVLSGLPDPRSRGGASRGIRHRLGFCRRGRLLVGPQPLDPVGHPRGLTVLAVRDLLCRDALASCEAGVDTGTHWDRCRPEFVGRATQASPPSPLRPTSCGIEVRGRFWLTAACVQW